MERLYFKVSNCKCATHFSPPVKKSKLTLIIFIVSLSIRKEQRSFEKRKGEEKRGSFAFRVCRNQSEGQGASSSIHHKDLQPSTGSMASGMYMHLICIYFQFLRCI